MRIGVGLNPAKDLQSHLGAKKLPHLMAVDDAQAGTGEVFSADSLNRQKLRDVVAKAMRRAKQKASSSLQELTEDAYRRGSCAPTDSQTCFIVLYVGGAGDDELIKALSKVAEKYRRDPVRFLWVKATWKGLVWQEPPAIVTAVSAKTGLVAVKPKRKKFRVKHADETVERFVDMIISGGLFETPLAGPLF